MLRMVRRRAGSDHHSPSPAQVSAILARSPGDRLADGLAAQMTHKQRRRFARALTTVKVIGDDPPPSFLTIHEEDGVFGLFVDADPGGGWSGATYPVDRLRARVEARGLMRCAATAAAEIVGRLVRDLEVAQRDVPGPDRELEVQHADDIALAAYLATPKHLVRIGDTLAAGRVPVLTIVGDTRTAFRRPPTFFVSVGSLPSFVGVV